MNPILNPHAFAPFSGGPFASGRSFQAEQTRAGSLSQTQSTDLTITTEEGDTVTISLASALALDAGSYSSQSVTDGRTTATRTAFFEYSGSQELAITVDGDLNADELEDIRNAMGVIGGMIEDFLSGDLQEMGSDGELLKELDTISGLEADFSYERQVTYGETEKVTLSTRAEGDNSHRYRSAHGRLHQLMNRINHLTDDMVGQVNQFGNRRQQMADSVNALLNRYRNGEVENAPDDDLSRSAIQTVQSVFTQKMEAMTESGDFSFSYTA